MQGEGATTKQGRDDSKEGKDANLGDPLLAKPPVEREWKRAHRAKVQRTKTKVNSFA